MHPKCLVKEEGVQKKLLETLQNQAELEGTAPDRVMLPPSEKRKGDMRSMFSCTDGKEQNTGKQKAAALWLAENTSLT